VSYFFLLIN
jgi:hypothetical protein